MTAAQIYIALAVYAAGIPLTAFLFGFFNIDHSAAIVFVWPPPSKTLSSNAPRAWLQ